MSARLSENFQTCLRSVKSNLENVRYYGAVFYWPWFTNTSGCQLWWIAIEGTRWPILWPINEVWLYLGQVLQLLLVVRLISVCTKNGIHVTIGTVVAVVDSVVRIVKFISNYKRYLDKRVATKIDYNFTVKSYQWFISPLQLSTSIYAWKIAWKGLSLKASSYSYKHRTSTCMASSYPVPDMNVD